MEALAALVILGVVGGPLLAAVLGALRSRETAAAADRRIQLADQTLQAVALLTRRDLERRLGRHQLGSFVVEVQRPERAIFSITLYEDSLAQAPLLATFIHRSPDTR